MDNPDITLRPMSGPTRAHEFYRGSAGRQYHQGKRGLPESAVPWVIRLRAARFQPSVLPKDAVFEFGAGAGWNLAGLRCRRRVAHDVENHLAHGPLFDGIEFIPSTADLPAASFEVILCHHALEHVDSPADVLIELGRLAAPAGRLLLAVPYESERRYRRFDPDEPNGHLFSWNAQTLGRLVATCGWEIQEVGIRQYGYDRFAAAWSNRMRGGESGFRILRRLLLLVRGLQEVVLTARKPSS